MWPFSKPETRAASSSYTDALIAAIVSGSGGSASGVPTATAALEACAGFVGRAFASAEVKPDIPALSPSTLALIGRDLIRRGESLHLIEVVDGEVELRPVGSWDVRGGTRESDWWYRCDTFGPSGSDTVYAPSTGVIHCRYAVDANRPYYGLGPIQIAHQSGKLSAETVTALADEAGRPRGSFLVLPDPSQATDIETRIKTAKGAIVGVEGGDWNLEQNGTESQHEYVETTIRRLSPPVALVQLMERAFDEVIAATGLTGLFSPMAPGTARRESYRQALHSVIAPLGKIAAAELTAKLDQPIVLDWAELKAGDIAGRSRAFQSLVGGGMSLQDAAAASGVLMAEAEQ